jgi:hypothetical protein
VQYGRPSRHTRRPCRSIKVSSSGSTERHSFGTFMQPSLATNVAARSEPGYERTTRLDPSGRVIFQQLEWSLLILVRANGRCRLAAATDPNPRGRVTLRTMRRPGHGPPSDASRGNSVARQRLAIVISGEDSLARRFWWHRAPRRRPLGPHRQKHCGHTHGSEVKRRTAWFHGSMTSTLAASRTRVCARLLSCAPCRLAVDCRSAQAAKRGILIARSRRTPACVHPAPTGLRAAVGHPINHPSC